MDHLVFAAPTLEEGVRIVEQRLGVPMASGGRHIGFGTHNRLLGLGERSYLEVVAIDPEQPEPERGRWFDLDELREPRLVTWCVQVPDLVTAVAAGREAGIDLGAPGEGSRRRPDGSSLSWTMTDPWASRAGGVVPFLIDWGPSAHPAEALASACRARSLRLEHPEPASLERWLGALGVIEHATLDIEIVDGDAARIVATLETPSGTAELS